MNTHAASRAEIESRMQNRSTNYGGIQVLPASEDIAFMLKAGKEGVILTDVHPKIKEELAQELGCFGADILCPYLYFKKLPKGYAVVDSAMKIDVSLIDEKEEEFDGTPPDFQPPSDPEDPMPKPNDLPKRKDDLDRFLDAIDQNMAVVAEGILSDGGDPPDYKWYRVYTAVGQVLKFPALNDVRGRNFREADFEWTGCTWEVSVVKELNNPNHLVVIKERGMIQPDMEKSQDDNWVRGNWLNAFRIKMTEAPSSFTPYEFLPENINGQREYTDKFKLSVTSSKGGSADFERQVKFNIGDWACRTDLNSFMWYQDYPWRPSIAGNANTNINDAVQIHDFPYDWFTGLHAGPIPTLSHGLWQYEAIYSYNAPPSRNWQRFRFDHTLQAFLISLRWHMWTAWRRCHGVIGEFHVKTLE